MLKDAGIGLMVWVMKYVNWKSNGMKVTKWKTSMQVGNDRDKTRVNPMEGGGICMMGTKYGYGGMNLMTMGMKNWREERW